jgi:hypothetical protein
MPIDSHPPAGGVPRLRRRLAPLAVAVALLALVAAGCGGSSKKSSSPSTSPSPATSTTQDSNPPLTKAEYEARLGPLLNNQVVPSLRAALANGGAADPTRLTQAINSLKTAHDQMAAVNPPTEIADLHQQAVTVLGAMVSDATKLRDAEVAHDTSAEQSAANALKADAQQIQNVGNQLTQRGY